MGDWAGRKWGAARALAASAHLLLVEFRIPNPQSQLLGHPLDRTARTRIAGELGGVGISRLADRAQRRHEPPDPRQAAVSRRRHRPGGRSALDESVLQRDERVSRHAYPPDA